MISILSKSDSTLFKIPTLKMKCILKENFYMIPYKHSSVQLFQSSYHWITLKLLEYFRQQIFWPLAFKKKYFIGIYVLFELMKFETHELHAYGIPKVHVILLQVTWRVLEFLVDIKYKGKKWLCPCLLSRPFWVFRGKNGFQLCFRRLDENTWQYLSMQWSPAPLGQ